MGLLATLLDPISSHLSGSSAAVLTFVGIGAFLVVSIVLNVLQQLLLKNSNEPPVVFHWVPFIGSTITYGIDPYIFFFRCREKVRKASGSIQSNVRSVWRRVYLYPPRQEDDCVLGQKGQRVYSQRQAQRCQCGGGIQQLDDPGIWY